MNKPARDKFDVQRKLASQNRTLTSLARDAGYSESLCRGAFCRPTLLGEALIIAATGYCGHEIWPDRYDCTGTRHVRQGKATQNRCVSQCQTASDCVATKLCSNHKRSASQCGDAL
ncbi:helix-turn-helix domain-containing protein [Pseudovibrio hongkongensis]|uniref:helix-turn-helix domain-containing protein n=1 Tax=Polycladidibacter hongkongensis TaxID=1647556 RepID=UPI00155E149E